VNGFEIARKHFESAIADATRAGLDPEAVARYTLSLVIAKYREAHSVEDVRSELSFLADNCDPETDYVFMRP
jgi:hypothetical protein